MIRGKKRDVDPKREDRDPDDVQGVDEEVGYLLLADGLTHLRFMFETLKGLGG